MGRQGGGGGAFRYIIQAAPHRDNETRHNGAAHFSLHIPIILFIGCKSPITEAAVIIFHCMTPYQLHMLNYNGS